MMDISFHSEFISTDVTAVKIVKDRVLAGIGNFLHVFNLSDSRLIARKKIFSDQKIHGFALGNNYTLVYGGRLFTILCPSVFDTITDTVNSPDWILTARWLSSENQLALALAHNVVVIWCNDSKQFTMRATCEEKCMLYSAELVGSSWQNLLLFAGTAFSEVIVWAMTDEDKVVDRPVLHRLKGHTGVIFSVAWNDTSQRLVSSSDDRSVRVWHFNWTKGEVTEEFILRGHIARVWRAMLTPKMIVSVGEDSQLVQWNAQTGQQVAVHCNAHQGGSIWSLDIDLEQQLIVTGGGDGGISVWSLGPAPLPEAMPECSSGVRCVCVSALGRVLAVTRSGDLCYWSEETAQWVFAMRQQLDPNKELNKEHAQLALSPCRTRFAVTAHNGFFIFVEHSMGVNLQCLQQLPSSVVLSLHWASSDMLLSAEVREGLKLWRCSEDSSKLTLVTEWKPSVKTHVDAALMLSENWIVIAGKGNFISLHNISDPVGSCHRVRNLVPGDTITSMHYAKPLLTVTGKEGHQNIIQFEDYLLRPSKATQTRYGWLAGSLNSSVGFLTLAFHGDNLNIHCAQHILLSVVCGGGHRSWDLAVLQNQLVFCFVRNHQIFNLAVNLCHIAPRVIRAGLHWRTVNCTLALHERLLVSGGDEGGVRVWRPMVEVPGTTAGHIQMGLLSGHVSSVRALCSVQRGTRHTLFSAGGRAQLMAWRFLSIEEDKFHAELVDSQLLCEPTEKCRTPWADMEFRPRPDPDMRYMDLCEVPSESEDDIRVLAACSDAMLRIFSLKNNKLALHHTLEGHRRCVLHVVTLDTLIVSAATDGQLVLWHNDLVKPPHFQSCLHQAGVNCVVMTRHNDDSHLLVTGGDDNVVTASLVSSATYEIKPLWSSSQGHSAQVTGAVVLNAEHNLILTTSIDQCLILWKDGSEVARHATTVADLQGLTFWHLSRYNCQICVYGKGFEVINLSWKSVISNS